jgi:hypothetical protein
MGAVGAVLQVAFVFLQFAICATAPANAMAVCCNVMGLLHPCVGPKEGHPGPEEIWLVQGMFGTMIEAVGQWALPVLFGPLAMISCHAWPSSTCSACCRAAKTWGKYPGESSQGIGPRRADPAGQGL